MNEEKRPEIVDKKIESPLKWVLQFNQKLTFSIHQVDYWNSISMNIKRTLISKWKRLKTWPLEVGCMLEKSFLQLPMAISLTNSTPCLPFYSKKFFLCLINHWQLYVAACFSLISSKGTANLYSYQQRFCNKVCGLISGEVVAYIWYLLNP